jgi:hypothetical protein
LVRRVVHSAVNFDGQAGLGAIEVQYVRPHGMLPAEFQAVELSAA